MSDKLRAKTLYGLFWSFLERFGSQATQFVISIILARLLLPAQFGVIAMLSVFLAISNRFVSSGFGAALVQKQDATHVDECSIFYFNILVSVLFAGLLFLTAPWIAGFYNELMLIPITRVMSLTIIIRALGTIQRALLTKIVDFKAQFRVNVVATIISGIIGIAMAYSGYGVWSLVVHSISSEFLMMVHLWLLNRWRPAWIFSLRSLREMFGFGSKLLLSGLLQTISENLYKLVIGKAFSAADLGFYSRAKSLQQRPVGNIIIPLERVTFPIFSSIQGDNIRLRRGAKKVLTTMAMLNFPLMVSMAVLAKPIVIVLLTDKWLPSVRYLQLLCVVGMFLPLHVINLNILKSLGRSDLILKLNIVKNVISVFLLILTCPYGIIAIIWGQIILNILAYYLNAHYNSELVGYSVIEQIKDLLPYIALSLILGAILSAIEATFSLNIVPKLIIQVMIGFIFFIFYGRIFKLSAFRELKEIVQGTLFKRI